MFGAFNKEKKKKKLVKRALSICHEYSSACVTKVCELKGVGAFDPDIREILESDDSIQFWYIVGGGLAYGNDLGDAIALVFATRILMQFQGLYADDVVDRAIELERTGLEKVQNGIIDRNSKVQSAAIAAVSDIINKGKITPTAISLYVVFICRQKWGETTFEEIDAIFGETDS